jgi:hypothetical protein
MNGTQPDGASAKPCRSVLWLLLGLFVPLSILCYPVYQPHRVMWANDSQLGAIKATCARLPDTFTGHWADNYWVGMEIPSTSPTLATLFQMVVSPEFYLKVFTPLTMLLLGFSAWLFFRELRFSPLVCVVGGLAAGLNMHFFSVACWGLGTWNICCAMVFLAMAAIVAPGIRQPWIKGALAGLAVGMGVMEGFDSGAILSVLVGVFALFYCFFSDSDPLKALARSAQIGFLMVFFAVLIAASTLSTLVGTQIKAISGMGQTPEEKQQHWNFATQWSIPKVETLRLIIPGLFGYRMREFTTSTDKSNSYWGSVAEDPMIEEFAKRLGSDDAKTRGDAAASLGVPASIVEAMRSGSPEQRAEIRAQILSKMPLQRRHSGNGEYAGVLIAVLAILALANSLRGNASSFSRIERDLVWFFGAAAIFSLVAAWGRHGPLYALLYKLPYFSTIRNPLKFMHPFHITWIIMAGFGLETLARRIYQTDASRIGVGEQMKRWWSKAAGFDKKWVFGSAAALAAGLAGLLIYSSAKADLIRYLTGLGDPNYQGFSPEFAAQVADYSVNQVLWFVIYLAASLLAVIIALSGAWSGRRAKLAWIFLGLIIICDLGRSDWPWVRYFDYTEKYSMNPITDFLRQRPYDNRVVGPRLSPRGGYDLAGDGNLGALSHWWIENDFPYYDIQSLDIDQWPRMPVLEANYLANFGMAGPGVARLWQLTNTRYIIANAGVAAAFNQIYKTGQPFVVKTPFTFTNADGTLMAKPGVEQIVDSGDVRIQTNNTGPFALIEYTDALPRAKLYSNWKILGDSETLQTLRAPEFDPLKTVLVATDSTVTQKPGDANADAGTVSISSYEPKDIKLKAQAKTDAVMLFNERTGDSWKVFVDRRQSNVLRCNYLMQGVMVPAGEHVIEFHFAPPIGPLYISLAAFGAGLLLAAYLVYTHWRPGPTEAAIAPSVARAPAKPDKAKV